MLALDISDIESRERTLTLTMFAFDAAVAAVLAMITHLRRGLARQALVIACEGHLCRWRRIALGSCLTIEGSAPHEAEVIAVALNDYLQLIDEFVVRERAFVNMASHELRTPIAVILAAAEVALDWIERPAVAVETHLDHILRTTRDMERLIILLVALAKDPARLRAAAENVDLRDLVPATSRDHAFLATHKELTFELDIAARCDDSGTRASRARRNRQPRAQCRREQRSRHHRRQGRRFTSDHRRSWSWDVERGNECSLHEARAWLGTRSPSAGIGLDLIARLCEHLGWKLAFWSAPRKGTLAVLFVFGNWPTRLRHAVY